METGDAVSLGLEKGDLCFAVRKRDSSCQLDVKLWDPNLLGFLHHGDWCCLSLFPLQVWNAVDSGHCLQTYSVHSEAVRAARWSPCGRRILSGGFDFALHLTDLETGVS